MLDLLLKFRRYLGWLFALLLLACMCPNGSSLLLWTPFVLAGAALRVWASGCIEKNIKIAWSGPYRHVRNPLYIGSFLIGLGFTLMANHWLPLALFLFFYLVVYRHGVITEEKLLTAKFGHDFKRYCSHVPRFIPRLRPTREFHIGWRGMLVIQHREYNAWLAIAALYLVLIGASGLDSNEYAWKGFREAGRILGS